LDAQRGRGGKRLDQLCQNRLHWSRRPAIGECGHHKKHGRSPRCAASPPTSIAIVVNECFFLGLQAQTSGNST
jgi:hypothetical protein